MAESVDEFLARHRITVEVTGTRNLEQLENAYKKLQNRLSVGVKSDFTGIQRNVDSLFKSVSKLSTAPDASFNKFGKNLQAFANGADQSIGSLVKLRNETDKLSHVKGVDPALKKDLQVLKSHFDGLRIAAAKATTQVRSSIALDITSGDNSARARLSKVSQTGLRSVPNPEFQAFKNLSEQAVKARHTKGIADPTKRIDIPFVKFPGTGKKGTTLDDDDTKRIYDSTKAIEKFFGSIKSGADISVRKLDSLRGKIQELDRSLENRGVSARARAPLKSIGTELDNYQAEINRIEAEAIKLGAPKIQAPIQAVQQGIAKQQVNPVKFEKISNAFNNLGDINAGNAGKAASVMDALTKELTKTVGADDKATKAAQSYAARLRELANNASLATDKLNKTAAATLLNAKNSQQAAASSKAMQASAPAGQKPGLGAGYLIPRGAFESKALNQISAAAAGTSLGLGILSGSIQSVAFGLIFMKFNIVSTQLAFAALALTVGSLTGIMIAAAKAFGGLEGSLQLLTNLSGSVKEGGAEFEFAASKALRYGFAIDDAASAFGNLKKNFLGTQENLQTITELAAGTGSSMVDASTTFSRAVGLQTGSLEALREVGIKVTDQQAEQFNSLDRLSRMTRVNELVNNQFVGSADRRINTLSGSFTRLTQAVRYFFGLIGGPIVKLVLVPFFNAIANLFNKLSEVTRAFLKSAEGMKLLGRISSTVQKILEELGLAGEKAGDNFKNRVSPAIYLFFRIVLLALQAVLKFIQGIKAMINALRSLLSTLKPVIDFLGFLAQKLKNLNFGAIFKTMKDFALNVPGIARAIAFALSRAIPEELLQSMLRGLRKVFGEEGAGIFTKFKDALKRLPEDIEGFFRGVGERIKNPERIIEDFKSMGRKIKDAAEGAFEFLFKPRGSLGKAFDAENLLKELDDLPKDVIEALRKLKPSESIDILKELKISRITGDEARSFVQESLDNLAKGATEAGEKAGPSIFKGLFKALKDGIVFLIVDVLGNSLIEALPVSDTVKGWLHDLFNGALWGALVPGFIGIPAGIVGAAVEHVLKDKLPKHIADGLTGAFVGAAAGGVLGFAIGGPLGAIIGIGLGAAIGFAIDYLKDKIDYKKVFEGLKGAATDVFDFFKNNKEAFKDFGKSLLDSATNVGVIVGAFGKWLYTSGTLKVALTGLVTILLLNAKAIQVIASAVEKVTKYFRDHKLAAIALGVALAAVLIYFEAIPAAILGIILAVGLIVRHWGTLKDKTLEVWNFVKSTILGVVDTIRDVFSPLDFSGIFDSIKEAVDAVLPVFDAVFATFDEFIKTVGFWADKLVTLGEKIGLVNGFFGTLKNVVAAAVIIFNPLGLAVVALYKLWESNFFGIRDATDRVFKGIKEIVTANMQSVLDIISFVLTEITGIAKVFAGIFQAVFGTLFALLRGDWSAAWENLKSGLSLALDGIITILKGWVDLFLKTVANIKDNLLPAGRDIGTGLALGFFSVVLGLLDWMRNLPFHIYNAIKDTLVGIYNRGREIGEQIIKGIVEGILNWRAYVPDALEGFVSGVIAKFNQAFGIHSPATTMIPVGENIVAGIAKGIENGANGNIGLDSVFDQLANQQASAYDSGQAFGSAIGSGISSALTDSMDQVGAIVQQQTSYVKKEIKSLEDILPNHPQNKKEIFTGSLQFAKDNGVDVQKYQENSAKGPIVALFKVADDIKNVYKTLTQDFGKSVNSYTLSFEDLRKVAQSMGDDLIILGGNVLSMNNTMVKAPEIIKRAVDGVLALGNATEQQAVQIVNTGAAVAGMIRAGMISLDKFIADFQNGTAHSNVQGQENQSLSNEEFFNSLPIEERRRLAQLLESLAGQGRLAVGGVAMRPVRALIGEGGMPEGVVPLRGSGAALVASALAPRIAANLRPEDFSSKSGGSASPIVVQVSVSDSVIGDDRSKKILADLVSSEIVEGIKKKFGVTYR